MEISDAELFTGRMPFLMHNQQCKGTEGNEVSSGTEIINSFNATNTLNLEIV